MLTWEGLLSREMPCLRCRSTKPIAGPLSADLRLKLAASGNTIATIKVIREETGCGLVEAKGTFQHLVWKPGLCHWCRKVIPIAELVDCPHCSALNISLSAEAG
jgi:hypothetical protein